MKRQAFKFPESANKPHAGLIVEITSCEDRGEYWYVSYRPLTWLDGKPIQRYAESFGAARIAKDGPKPERLPIRVRDIRRYGVGQRAGFYDRTLTL